MRSSQNISIKDVARRAGVSIASVSRVLNEGTGSFSEKTKQRVLKAVKELNYNPNRIGRALRAQTTDTYALIISNIQNNFYAAVAWEIERLLGEQGKAVLLFTTNEDPDIQDRCLEEIRSRQVIGTFMLCAVESPRLVEMAKEDKVIFINRRIRSLPDVPFIGIDDMSASKELMRGALRQDEGRIGIIYGPQTSDTSSRRLEGMLAICEEMGRPVRPEDRREALLSMESGYEAAVSLMSQEKFTSLFCGSDQIAYGAYRRCRELGLDVPDDVRIYGFDDNPMNEWLAPWLNTVRVPHLGFAKAAVEQMKFLKDGLARKETVLPYELIMRA
jgi:LacI family transcriptional regulator